MLKKQDYKFIPLDVLYAQIDEILKIFASIQSETAGILEQTQVPDATAHLNDVLQSTEEATTTIIESAGHIQGISDVFAPAESASRIRDYVTTIYEACTFQDISGQRIKKVLKSLSALEDGLKKLAEITQAGDASSHTTKPAQSASLLNGPQLTSEAPTQDDIDHLFSKL